ncbi:aldo/keto reductase [Actinospongicola halichondriae]|uniref:aldo/keto reductase n=1 Tax=Actinospongicola halichondriae TaxID=3236844 RepID=UPI003D53044E
MNKLGSGRLGLGGAALGNLYDAVTEQDSDETIAAAWARGIRLFDTAPLYGHGLSETRVGRGLAPFPRDETILSTKVGRVLVPDDASGGDGDPDTIFADVPPVRPEFDFSEAGVEASLTASLERLGTDRLDIVHVHDPDDHLEAAIAETYPALARWRDEAVIGAIGLGTNLASVADHVLDHTQLDWLLLAGRYTLLDRSGADVLDRCADLGVQVMAAGVFNSGLLANPTDDAHFHYAPAPPEVIAEARRLAEICARHEVPLAAAALQFPLRHPAVTLVLPGARSAAEIDTDVDLFDLEIPDALWDELLA